MLIDRNSFSDAKKRISFLLSKHGSKHEISEYLASKIEYANQLNKDNWNLNLSLDGKFLRFNTGQEFCIQIDEHRILILCIRKLIPKSVKDETNDIYFLGYDKKSGEVSTQIFSEAPDILHKVQDSIGIVIIKNAAHWLGQIEKSNTQFIKSAISNTKILPQMMGAHSVGAIDFIA